MANYKSNYTGAEIDSAVNKANSIPEPASADVGKVLGVVEDENENPVMGLVAGKEPIVIDVIVGKSFSVNMTRSELYSLMYEKAVVLIKMHEDNEGAPTTWIPATYLINPRTDYVSVMGWFSAESGTGITVISINNGTGENDLSVTINSINFGSR